MHHFSPSSIRPAPASADGRRGIALHTPTKEKPGRAYLGLAFLGWGLSILLGITPHENRIVGSALAAFGAALLFTARGLPEPRGLPAAAVGTLGLITITSVTALTLVLHASWDVRKVLILALGVALLASSPFLSRTVPFGRGGRRSSVAALVMSSLAVLGAPLAIWALQATTKDLFGSTPMEAFVRSALIFPLSLLFRGMGLDPHISGQTITYGTPRGPLSVEVGAACSGIQAMVLFAAVLAIYLWIEKPGGRRLALWSVIGLGGVYIANLLRLVVVTLVGYEWGAAALVQVHEQAGWIFFVAWALLFTRLARTPRPNS